MGRFVGFRITSNAESALSRQACAEGDHEVAFMSCKGVLHGSAAFCDDIAQENRHWGTVRVVLKILGSWALPAQVVVRDDPTRWNPPPKISCVDYSWVIFERIIGHGTQVAERGD